MRMLDPSQMLEATRLTRAGKLTEAVALLQGMIGGVAPQSSAARPAPIHPTALRRLPVIDAVASNADPVLLPRVESPPHIDLPIGNLARARRAPQPAELCPAGGVFEARSFASQVGSRSFKLYVPSRYKGEPTPLIVMLHGCTQSADDFAAGTRMNFAAEEHSCFVVYPEQSQAANASKCWNWFKTSDQQRGGGEPELIAGIVRKVIEEFKIDTRRIYVAGLSAGGAAAAIAGEAYPDLFAAVGVHSGLPCGAARDLPSAFAAMRGTSGARAQAAKQTVPTIVFHGDRDTTVHPRNAEEVIARANPGGSMQVSLNASSKNGRRKYTRSVQRNENGKATLELWVVHGAAHAWSGGSPAGSFTDPKGPDATKEMLRFFLSHAQREA